MNSLDLIARMKPTDEFIAAAAGQDLTAPDAKGVTLLQYSLANTKPDARYATTTYLLDQGVGIGKPGSEGNTVLHVLFGAVKHVIDEDVSLLQRLLALGADVNALNNANETPFFEVLRMRFTDEDMEPIYSIWFDQPVTLDFTTVSKRGVSPIEYAEKVSYRADIAERMKAYVAEHS